MKTPHETNSIAGAFRVSMRAGIFVIFSTFIKFNLLKDCCCHVLDLLLLLYSLSRCTRDV